MSVHRVRTRAQLRTFQGLSARIAAARGESDHYVPLLASDLTEWHRGTGWFTEEVELWLVRAPSGTAVGRVMCHTAEALATRIAASDDGPAPRTLFFGALEAADPGALEEIIAFLQQRAEHLGAARLFGPVSPLPNVTGGLLTAGTEHPGFFDTAWNPDFFAPVFARAGFATWGDAQTWEVDLAEVPAERAAAVTPAEWSSHGLRRRPVSRFRLKRFAARMLPTLNSAFSALPYYTPISPAQLTAQMAGLPALLDPALVVDVAGAEDDDAAPARCFALVIPDPLPILRRHGGRLGPAALWDLARARTRLSDAVLIIQGTDPRFQGRGLLSLVIREVYAGLRAGGYRRLRVTFIAEDNPASAAVFARAGGRPLHSLSFLDRRLDQAERPDIVTALLRHAARAPSAHNTQPWVPAVDEIAADGSYADLVLTVDPDRTLPIADPRCEDLHLSLGCWVEALSIAAAEAGLETAVTAVTGWGPGLEVRLRLSPGPVDDVPFTTADLWHRQVDRGTLTRDDAAFTESMETINADLEGTGAALIAVPEEVWSPLLRRASQALTADPAMFAETLRWLRFDPADPAYREDGLSAECLRIPAPAARLAGALNRESLRPAITTATAAALAPLSWLRRRLPRPGDGRRHAPRPGAAPTTPHHLILHVPDSGPDRDAAAELAVGRALLRAWLHFDRAGLRVDVHSEIKDCPATHAGLRRHLGGARPIAAFSVGRSTSPVPRSPRLPPRVEFRI